MGGEVGAGLGDESCAGRDSPPFVKPKFDIRGLCPFDPGIYRFGADWFGCGTAVTVPPVRTRVGAQVASLRSLILRASEDSIS
jgi:hypothetical protein